MARALGVRSRVRAAAVVVPIVLLALAAVGGGPGSTARAADPATSASTVQAIALCPDRPGALHCLAERLSGSAPAVAARVAQATGIQPAGTPGLAPAATSSGYTPTQLRDAYQIPAATSARTVAIVDAYGAPSVESDLAQYRSTFGLPACTTADGCFTKVNQTGTAAPLPAYDSGWAGETTLDVEMVSAICPTCHILLVEATDDDSSGRPNLETAAAYAASTHPAAVSMSWGGGEWSGETSSGDPYLAAARTGVPFVAAAGDHGWGASWPAANPYVTAVGGTSLTKSGNTRGWTETVWNNNNGWATGSGCSAYESAAPWQPAAAAAVCPGRAAADVAMVADPDTGVAVYQAGGGNAGWWVYGGTSAATPMVAALYAMANTADGTDAPAAYPYLHGASAFTDVTSGSNGSCAPTTLLCTAAAGWDGPTGLGTPIGLTGFTAPATTPPAPTGTVTVRDPGAQGGWLGSPVSIDTSATDTATLALHYAATGLPAGLGIGSGGRISGSPTRAGTFSVRVTATDTAGVSGSITFTLTVREHRLVTGRAPWISGGYRVASTLTLNHGGWRLDSPTGPVAGGVTVRVQWYADGAPISGAAGYRYTVARAVQGKRLSVRLSGTRASTLAWIHTINHAGTVAAEPRLVTAVAPRIAGRYRVGATLTLRFGGWRDDRAAGPGVPGVTTRYQWYVHGVPVRGAVRGAFRLPASARGKRIAVRLTGSRPAMIGYARTLTRAGTVG